MKNGVRLTVIAAAMLLNVSFAHGADVAPTESLPKLVDLAIANNPDLKASEARWRMFRNRVLHEGRLEDPMLMLKIQNGLIRDPLNFSKDPMTQKVIGLSQQIPFWGKRALRQEVAAQEAESYRWAAAERKLELAKMVADAYYQIYFIDKALEIVDRNIGILDDFTTLAETKYSVGQGSQQDVFKSQVERSRMLDMRIRLEQQRKSLQVALNALLYRPSGTPIGAIPDFELKPVAASPGELEKIAFENRPILKSQAALIEKGKAGYKLAQKDLYPDFNVSLEYMQRDRVGDDPGYDMYGLGVTFNLPVYRHHRHEMIAEADASVQMASEELKGVRNNISSGIADLLAQLDKTRKLVDLYKTGTIPQAQQSLESATIGYRVNKVDFLTLQDNRITLFNYERDLYESMADYQVKRAQLEALIGKEL